jgi:hypothetical protein
MATRIQKFEKNGVTPLAGRIFGTIMVYISEEMAAWINENEARVVGEYVERKLREAGESRTIKCGRTVTAIDPNDKDLVGYFHWSLKGEFYDQVVVWNENELRWEYAKH